MGDRKKDKMKARNKDSSMHFYLLEIDQKPEKLVRIAPIFYCEKCKKEIPEKHWKIHKENHKKIDRINGHVKRYAKKYF